MDVQATAKILRLMSEIPDFRKPQRQHLLSEIVTIAIFAVICGADGWVEVEEYGQKKFGPERVPGTLCLDESLRVC